VDLLVVAPGDLPAERTFELAERHDREACRIVALASVAALPISFRPALLAGLSRAIAHPAILDAIRDETILRGRRAFERLREEARIDAHATGKSRPT